MSGDVARPRGWGRHLVFFPKKEVSKGVSSRFWPVSDLGIWCQDKADRHLLCLCAIASLYPFPIPPLSSLACPRVDPLKGI